MPKISKKQIDAVKLAEKKGNDADLFLLDKIHSVEDNLKTLEVTQEANLEKAGTWVIITGSCK